MQIVKFIDINGQIAKFQRLNFPSEVRICSLTKDGIYSIGNNQSISEAFDLWCDLKGESVDSLDAISEFCGVFGLKARDLS